jgi:hypothetical protein
MTDIITLPLIAAAASPQGSACATMPPMQDHARRAPEDRP